ncbi:MFS transporter [Actinomadura sp. DC4]|uniref:MFS transporter n=1 Tax=Actinomadura sp. DC4 TaxID=3055069 RepID=UPI0025AF0823|nr:MFS transporter [Actinomadura sp. DC4]MDN3358763.1 MFS transporter [Actinomadura sp. DC4]
MTTTTLDRATGDPKAAPGFGALLVLLSGTFITTLDFFIVNVAIPATQRDLRAGPAVVQFIVAGFGLALAAGLITGGRLGDLYGRRRMFALGLGLFTLASLACGVAPTAGVLIGARVAQGAAAALLMPQVLAIVTTVYTGEHRARAFNAYGLAMGFGGVFGQLIGGLLIKADIAGLGWRAVFLINVPVGIAAVPAALRLVPESRAAYGARLDVRGTLLVSAGLVLIVLPLVEGRQQGWPLWTWLCLAAAPLVLAGFAAYQRRIGGERALIDLHLFRHRAFAVGAVIALVGQLAVASFFLVLALYLQQGRGLSPLESGLIFLALGAGYFVSSSRAAQVAARLGRQVVAVGALTLGLGYGLLAAGTSGGVGWLVPGLLVAGCGMGLVMAPLPAIALNGVEPRHAASAAGVVSTSLQAGGAIGVAVIGVVFYDVLGTGRFTAAFVASLAVLAGFCAASAGLVQLLPRNKGQKPS